LSVELGPGLIGEIYDGIQRPLRELREAEGDWLKPGIRLSPLDRTRKWRFTPDPELAAELAASSGQPAVLPALEPGHRLGTLPETPCVEHRVLVPPGLGGRLAWLAPKGEYTIDEAIARSAAGEEIRLSRRWPVRTGRPFRQKLALDRPLVTGLRVVDVFFPIAKGGTAAIPGGFGTGKTLTQHAIAKWCDADIIIYIGCGERGNEMTEVLTEFPELVDPRTGQSLMARTILIANTSNMPVAAREVSIYTGITLGEYYRDMGYDVAILADSTSRWAEALRELSGRQEEMPAEEGFPAYLPTRLAEFYERGGRVATLGGAEGSISIVGAVSPPGGDFSEPVTQHTKRFIRCFWALDRDLANARHYPAIGWIESYSDYVEEIAPWWAAVDPNWLVLRAEALGLLKQEQKLEQIVRLIGPDALPDDQRLVLLTAELLRNGFLQQNSFDEVDRYCRPDKQLYILRLAMEFHRRAAALIQAGLPLPRIAALASRERLMRLKSVVANGDAAGLDAAAAALDDELAALEAQP
jgi:V/A-type H+-transporting ATPase subunit A